MKPSKKSTRLALLRANFIRDKKNHPFGQKEFADMCDISFDTLQSLEIGRLKLSKKMAYKIGYKTGVSPEWLSGGKPDPVKPPIDKLGKLYLPSVFHAAQKKAALDNEKSSGAWKIADEPDIIGRFNQIFDVIINAPKKWEAQLELDDFAEKLDKKFEKDDRKKSEFKEKIEVLIEIEELFEDPANKKLRETMKKFGFNFDPPDNAKKRKKLDAAAVGEILVKILKVLEPYFERSNLNSMASNLMKKK